MDGSAYYKAVYGDGSKKVEQPQGTSPRYYSPRSNIPSPRTSRYDNPYGHQTERSRTTRAEPDPYTASLATHRSNYAQRVPQPEPGYSANSIKSIELTTNDNKKLRFDVTDSSRK